MNRSKLSKTCLGIQRRNLAVWASANPGISRRLKMSRAMSGNALGSDYSRMLSSLAAISLTFFSSGPLIPK
jgi:hypothetical protein